MDPIKPEFLLTELNGNVIQKDDYLGQAAMVLEGFVVDDRDVFQNANDVALPIWRASELLRPGYRGLEQGCARLRDGTWYIVSRADVGEVTGKMFDWWLSRCDSSEAFTWWHPYGHTIGGEFEPSFYATPPNERRLGYYIGHSFACGIALSGLPGEYSLLFQYKDPSDILDTSLMEAGGVTCCAVARIYISTPSGCLGEAAVGYICFMLCESSESNELVTRVWLGDIERISAGWPPGPLVSWFGNTYAGRSMFFSRDLALAVWKHGIEMSSCLRAFLPSLYSNTTGVTLPKSPARKNVPSTDPKPTIQRRVIDNDVKEDEDSSLGSLRLASDTSSRL